MSMGEVGERAGRPQWGGGYPTRPTSAVAASMLVAPACGCPFAHLALARLRRHVQRRRAACVAPVDVSFGFEQHPHHLHSTVARRCVEGARFGVVGEPNVAAPTTWRGASTFVHDAAGSIRVGLLLIERAMTTRVNLASA